MRKHRSAGEKPLYWVGSSKKDFLAFPEEVVDNIGYALGAVQKKSPSGVRTARTDIDLIEERLKSAREDCEERYGKETD